MATSTLTKSAQIRARLKHPIIDADGHHREFYAVYLDYVREIGGHALADRVAPHIKRDWPGGNEWWRTSERERLSRGMNAPAWFGGPTKSTLDRAAAHLPKLMYQRLDEMGIDYAVVYPTRGMVLDRKREPEIRQVMCRALNAYMMGMHYEYADRLMPAAIIPMQTPAEAIAELDYAVKVQGFKVVFLGGSVPRPIDMPDSERGHRAPERFDTFGLDSEFDYDPVWAKCVELKVAPTFHSPPQGGLGHSSPSTYTSNHIHSFAFSNEAICKSLFLGGVTHRFPTLRFAFLEGGVGWACSLFAELLGHWEKRGPQGLHNIDPRNMDKERVMQLVAEYGGERVQRLLEQIRPQFFDPKPHPEPLDDFHRCGITRKQDIADLFVDRFFFGCEADDPMNAWAFNRKVNPLGTQLNAIVSSDVGHWDVPDITKIVEEAWELVERDLITEDDFQAFTFTNPVNLWGASNPDFCNGTRVEADVKRLLGTTATATAS